jgi:uncharacterized membrane protein
MKEKNFEALTWHDQHRKHLTYSQILADKLALGMGSWIFLITQTVIILLWIALNIIGFVYHWDPYPFILLNLLFSVQAAYAAPVIMMSQNRQSERDRHQALDDYKTNKEAKKEIEQLQLAIARIENEKLNEIMKLLADLKSKEIAA